MNLNLSKQWCEEKFKLEGDSEIGAGNPNFNKYYLDNNLSEDYQNGFNHCRAAAIKIINETPLGYRTDGEHEKLEKFADLIENKIKNL